MFVLIRQDVNLGFQQEVRFEDIQLLTPIYLLGRIEDRGLTSQVQAGGISFLWRRRLQVR